jgi:hypothetical protein
LLTALDITVDADPDDERNDDDDTNHYNIHIGFLWLKRYRPFSAGVSAPSEASASGLG